MTPWRHAWPLLAALAGCGAGSSAEPQGAPAPAAVEAALPTTADGFLRELLPLPAPAVYEVHGPGGLQGTLELLARPGGQRRENWTLRLARDGKAMVTRRATRIFTPARMWAGGEGRPGVVAPLPLADLGRAYEALPPARRRAVVRAVRDWHEELARARREHPGELRTVAGQTCTWTRAAAQTLCMWEEAGLPLRYEGPALSAEAVRIDRAPALTLASDAFELPPAAARAREVPAPERLARIGPDLLDRLEVGDVAALALTLQPGFRPPLDDSEAPSAGQIDP